MTRQWHEHWVLGDITDEDTLEKLLQRPFFLLISVDAPVSVRWQRHKSKWVSTLHFLSIVDIARCLKARREPPSLETFVLQSDKQLYSTNSGLSHILGRAQLRLLNSGNSIPEFRRVLDTLDLQNESRLRPSWDEYFMQLADLAAQRSNCMKRRVGCVLMREKRVISTGYNGTPRNVRNCNQGGCEWCSCPHAASLNGTGPRCNGAERAGAGLATCLCLHAEENALLEAGRDRIREGAILYCNT